MANSAMPARPGRLVAVGRAGAASLPVLDQLAAVESWARSVGYDVVRPLGRPPRRASHHPDLSRLLEVVDQGRVEAVGVTDVSRLAPTAGALHDTVAELDARGVALVTPGTGTLNLDDGFASSLFLAAVLEQIFDRERAEPRRRRRALRVAIDLDRVARMQARGATLTDIAWHLGVGRATLVRRLRRVREDEARAGAWPAVPA